MRSIPEITEKIILESPYFLEGLRDDLLNISAVSRKIKPLIEAELQKEIKTAAIIMAMKRFIKNINPSKDKKLQNILKGLSELTVRSNLVEYTFKNSESLKNKQVELLSEIASDEQIFFTLSRGVFETTMVISQKEEAVLNKLYKNEVCLSNIKNLSSITIKLPKSNTEVAGVYYYLLKRLAWRGINITAVISTTNEFTIVLKEDEINRAFSILNQLKKTEFTNIF